MCNVEVPMINIKCSAPDKVMISSLVPFQGDLKKRTEKDIRSLADSLREDGLLMPFAVWKHKDQNYLLDGHGRLAALTELALEDNDIVKQKMPAIFIDAETEDEAKKALLQITSAYGKVTKDGAFKFTASIPEYRAPAINRFVHKKVAVRTTADRPVGSLIRIRVPSDKEEAVRRLLAQVEYITVL